MRNPFFVKLESFAVPHHERDVLRSLTESRIRRVGPRVVLRDETDHAQVIRIMMSGWACCYKNLPDGRRQTLALFLPGDLCDPGVFVTSPVDHSIETLSAVAVAEVAAEHFTTTIAAHPGLRQALWLEATANASIQREWTASLGRRTALERIAHLCCELYHRLRLVGLTEASSCDFPLSQFDLAEINGLSSVHVNRTLQELRRRGLLLLKRNRLTIPDLPALEQAALFNAGYLHSESRLARLMSS